MEKLIAAATSAQQPAKLRLAVLNGANTGLNWRGCPPQQRQRLLAAVPRRGRLVRAAQGGREAAGGTRRTCSAGIAVDKESGEMGSAAKAVVDNLTWPGKPVPPAPKNTRTPEEEVLFKAGKGRLCHQLRRLPPGSGPGCAARCRGTGRLQDRHRAARRGSARAANGKDGSIGEMPPLGQSLATSSWRRS